MSCILRLNLLGGSKNVVCEADDGVGLLSGLVFGLIANRLRSHWVA